MEGRSHSKLGPRGKRPLPPYHGRVNHGVGGLTASENGGRRHWHTRCLGYRTCCSGGKALMGPANHSFNFDHRRRPDTLRTAIATAFF
jgi:hypothetical protein